MYSWNIPHIRELSIIKNLAPSTLNLGLWWESDPVEVLRFLHYKCGMPAALIRQHIMDPVVPPPVAQDVVNDDQLVPEIHDWRAYNKAELGITYQTAIYSPLAFRRADPRWIQHWLMNALGRYLSLSVILYHQTDTQVCTWILLAIGYNYYQSITGTVPTPDVMALIVGKGEVEGIQWDELKMREIE